MVRRVVMLIVLLISIVVYKSVEAIAIGYCISSWLDAIISAVPAKQLFNYGIRRQFGDLWRTILASAVMFGCVQLMNVLLFPMFVLLLGQVCTGVIVYQIGRAHV